MNEHTYIAIDLKSFYASVECVERGLDPLKTNLVVADESRTEKTICLAVSPSLKACGISGRARLFEVVQQVRTVNRERQRRAPNGLLKGSSADAGELKSNPALALSYIAAVPRMAYYMQYSTRIYQIYLKYIAPEDIHVYSIDEVFMDVTAYLKHYQMNARQMAMMMIRDVLKTTGITATAGIGTNLYLCKAAMDIVAKHIPADKDGVRIAELDEMGYRRQLWDHRPLTDFWRVGRGIAKKLEDNGLYTMGDIARCSVGSAIDKYNEDFLYQLFGINAELLIDHAWGWEPCTIREIRAYRPACHSVGSGQVLPCAYTHEKAAVIVREMAESLAMDLVDKVLVTDLLTLNIGFDIDNLTADSFGGYQGEVTEDRYGRKVPKSAHGSSRLSYCTSSASVIAKEFLRLFERIADQNLTIRRIAVSADHTMNRGEAEKLDSFEQMSLFSQPKNHNIQPEEDIREQKAQEAILALRKKFGKTAVIKGTDLEEGATAVQRSSQIGGHRA
ncbi:MAG: DNA methylase [Erysipelotrichia bacterium]|nr:DNA methylase [Erysipelotrichia bacterium]